MCKQWGRGKGRGGEGRKTGGREGEGMETSNKCLPKQTPEI